MLDGWDSCVFHTGTRGKGSNPGKKPGFQILIFKSGMQALFTWNIGVTESS